MKSCIYEGWVRHRRFTPVANAFRYRLFMMYLDLDELEQLFRKRWLWSAHRPAVAWFRRSDHSGDPEQTLDWTIRELVEQDCGKRPTGPIRVLTHLRYFGHCFNPVSFFYCFSEDEQRIETIVAEVANTPWNERHCYVMHHDGYSKRNLHRYRFDKGFHVSPFIPMDVAYDWRFRRPGLQLALHNNSHRDGEKFFDATLNLQRREITGFNLARVLARYPLMTLQVVALIHWQALRLWCKRLTFYPHPSRQAKKPVRNL